MQLKSPLGALGSKGHLAVLLATLVLGFGLGVVLKEFRIFPFGQGHFAGIYGLFVTPKTAREKYVENFDLGKACRWHVRHFNFYADAAREGYTIERIFIGDSVVEMMWDNDIFKTNYRRLADSGNIIECLPSLTESVLSLNPKKVLIYLGGNDADMAGRQSPEQAAATYRKFVETLAGRGVTVSILGVHLGTERRRNRPFVTELNERLQRIAADLRVQYIPPLEAFDFGAAAVTGNPLTYEGEHLTYDGYKTWFDHLRKHVEDFGPDGHVVKK